MTIYLRYKSPIRGIQFTKKSLGEILLDPILSNMSMCFDPEKGELSIYSSSSLNDRDETLKLTDWFIVENGEWFVLTNEEKNKTYDEEPGVVEP